LATIHFYQESFKKSISLIDEFFKKNKEHSLYWSAQSLKLYSLLKLNQTKKAKTLRDNIVLNCGDSAIKEGVESLNI